MTRRYPQEVKDFIRDNRENMSNRRLAAVITEKFGFEVNEEHIRTYIVRNKLKRSHRRHLDPIYSDLFPKHVVEFIQENHEGISTKEMAKILNETFGLSLTHQQVITFYKSHKIRTGNDTRFQKGHESWLKGKKGIPSYSYKTTFKPGMRAHNYMPVGTVSKNTDGYWRQKVADPAEWKFCHLLEWEKHNGPVPKGNMVIFLDGNRDHYTIDNLAMITLGENGIMNKKGLRFEDAEYTQAAVNAVKLCTKVKEMRSMKRSKDEGETDSNIE